MCKPKTIRRFSHGGILHCTNKLRLYKKIQLFCLCSLVDERCFPYKAAVVRCPFKPRGNLIDDGCRPPVKQRTSRYKVGPPGRLSKEEDIMYDIMESGPVQGKLRFLKTVSGVTPRNWFS